MIHLAVIKKNNYYVDIPEIEEYYNKKSTNISELKDKIKNSFKNLVEFIEIDENSLIENIVSKLDYHEGDQIDTIDILETNDKVFQMCVIIKENDPKNKEEVLKQASYYLDKIDEL